ncbi:hypothetical protein ACWCOT_24480 [Nonomuraea bangladeshensis]
MSRDIGNPRTYEFGVSSCSGCLGLVVAGRVEDQLAQEFSGDGVGDADVQVVDQEDDVGSGVGSSDADVVQPAVPAQGDHS